MTHPDYIVAPEARADLPLLEPVYPLTAGLSGKVLLKAARQALERVPDLPEWQDAGLAQAQRGWPDAKTALPRLHRPDGGQPTSRRPRRPGSASPTTSCWPASWRSPWCGRASSRSPAAASRATAASAPGIADALPFALTNSQRQALKEIAEDMAAPHRMLRLLQGDVGSGKTVVALMAMAIAVEAGAQAALMAPTEVLARQHAGHHRAACRAGGPARRPADGPREGPRARRAAASGWRPARSTS